MSDDNYGWRVNMRESSRLTVECKAPWYWKAPLYQIMTVVVLAWAKSWPEFARHKGDCCWVLQQGVGQAGDVQSDGRKHKTGDYVREEEAERQ